MTEPNTELPPSDEAGKFDEHVAVTIRTAVDEWRIHNDPADPHGVSMPEYIRRALADAGLLAPYHLSHSLCLTWHETCEGFTIISDGAEAGHVVALNDAVRQVMQEREPTRVEQLTAEVERLKDVDAEAFAARYQVQCLDIALGRTAHVLTRLLADANIAPPPEKRLPHLAFRVEEEFQAVVRQRDEALAALEKQQAVLARAVLVWPQDAMVRIRECIADPSRMLPRQDETVASWGARAVLKLMESWRVFTPAAEAPQSQSADEEVGDELQRLMWERMIAAAPEGHKAYKSVWGEQTIMRCGCGTKVGSAFAYRLHLEALAEQSGVQR